ncbi:MAG: phenylalanine--tRNA ligase subunit beta [Dehalococcoidales bacterium]|nr:MAG: phenylalanine--tRNA ligase subunit beta [Dehalococcoidales bacterium]
MKVSISWLKEYVDFVEPLEDIAHKLTMAGFEVEEIIRTGSGWDKVVVAQIKTVNPHPNADRLTLPTLDLGGEEATVVCGAPNLKVGDKVPFACVGAELIDGHTGKLEVLKPAKIRGVESAGMVCSEKELGISERHEGILVLPDDAPVGTPLADYMGDVVFDIDITPNRADCLSVIGIAREVAALTGQKVHIPEVAYEETGDPLEDQITIEINAPDLCPRYAVTLIRNVTFTESPPWMQQRLLAAGMRPINNLVDVTNYVMLEYGQPLHSFDYDKIRAKKIIVRRASDYEPIITLDDNERELNSGMLVISDPMGAVAVAGVMGGANSEVTENTTAILLEAASFNPKSIHYTGRHLGIPSEACMRFERGISRELTLGALKRATQLLAELGGGEVAKGIVDIYPEKLVHEPITLSAAAVERHIGREYSMDEIASSLELLGFDIKRDDSAGEVTAIAPYWRTDISIREDLIEEIVRVVGYDEIPTTMISEPIPRHDAPPVVELKREIIRILTGCGLQEIKSYTMTGLDMIKKISTGPAADESSLIRVSNPITADQEYMRPSLRMNLLIALESNRRYQGGGIRIFEVGKVFIPRQYDLPEERVMLCGLIAGIDTENSWHGEGRQSNFYDAKGVIETLLDKLGVEAVYIPGKDAGLHASRQASVMVDGKEIGVIGEVHPLVLEKFDIDEPAYLFEIDLPALLEYTLDDRTFTTLPRFPSVVRDMALIVDSDVIHTQIVEIIRGYSLVVAVDIFDVYSGEQVPPSKKSLAYRLTYQSPDHTLTDKEVNKVQEQILKKLEKDLGATLRV